MEFYKIPSGVKQVSTEIISAIISLIGVIFSAVVSLQLVNWRLKQLENKMDEVDKKLEIHNQYAIKFAELTGDIKAISLEIKHIKEMKEKELS